MHQKNADEQGLTPEEFSEQWSGPASRGPTRTFSHHDRNPPASTSAQQYILTRDSRKTKDRQTTRKQKRRHKRSILSNDSTKHSYYGRSLAAAPSAGLVAASPTSRAGVRPLEPSAASPFTPVIRTTWSTRDSLLAQLSAAPFGRGGCC